MKTGGAGAVEPVEAPKGGGKSMDVPQKCWNYEEKDGKMFACSSSLRVRRHKMMEKGTCKVMLQVIETEEAKENRGVDNSSRQGQLR